MERGNESRLSRWYSEKRDERDFPRTAPIVSTLRDRESCRHENRLGLSCPFELISLIYLEIPSLPEFSINLQALQSQGA
jgi:hypothetical protein